MQGMESRETAPERREDLFSLLSEVEGLAGRSIAMLSDEAWAPSEQVSLAEVQDDVRQFENERWLRQEILRFEEIVRRNVRHHFFEQQQVLADGAAYSPEGMSTLEAISLRMTLWKYEEAHLKEYIDALRRYRTHVETYKGRAQGLRDDTTIQKYELMSALALGRLKELVPAMQATTRLVWALEYLEADKEKQVLSAQDRAQLEKIIQYLRQRLPEKGTAVHPAIQDIAVRRDSSLAELQVAREVLAGRMREVFVEKVQVDVRKSALSPSVGVPYALYLQFLQLHRRAAFEELRDAQTPTVEQYVEFLDVCRSINEQSLEYHVATLKHNADVQSLLAMRERFGPEAFERLRSNPQKSQEISDFYKRFLLSKETTDAPADENLVKTLKEKELAHYQAGMSAYLEVVSEDISRYGSMVDRLENMLIGARDAEDLLLKMRHGTVEIAYWVPEHTLGLARFVGLDYTKLIGQYEAMKNHRAVTEFRELESDTESMKAIFSEAQPGLRVARAAVEADMQQLAALQKEHPPEECAPGRAHNGVKYETIRQQYIGTIERMRDHHDEWIALLDALYENMQGNLNYHVNRLAQNRLLNTQNAPNAVVGALVTSLELYYATGNVKYLNRLVPGSRSFARSVNWPIKQGSRLLYRGGRWAAVRARSAVTSKALPTTMAPKPKVVPRAPEVPKAALKGSVGSASRIRGLLGKAGTVLLAAEAGRQIDLTISLRDVPETQAIDDALELMEGHPQINRDVARYHQEVASLRQRKELIAVREATSAVRAKLLQTKGLSRSLMQRRHALLAKAEQVISYANAQNRDLHSFFPITEYIKQSSRDPEGVVRLTHTWTMDAMTHARMRGMKRESRPQLSLADPLDFEALQRESHWMSLDGLETEFDSLLQGADQLLRDMSFDKQSTWENRGARISERNEDVQVAQERVRQHLGLVGYVPGALTVNEQTQTVVERAGTFQMATGDGATVAMESPPWKEALSVRRTDRFDTEDFKFAVTDSNGKKTNYSINLATLERPNEYFTKEDIDLCRNVLTTPLDLTGHPNAADKDFVESVRRYELDRMLDMAEYKDSYSWNSFEFRSNLFRELWPYYRDAESKQGFLHTLLNNLLEYSPVSGGAFSGTYDTILDHMKRKY